MADSEDRQFKEVVLPRLVAAYEAGRLVPFIGSGMSRRTVTDWVTFVRKLEEGAGISEDAKPGVDTPPPREDLIRRANRAVRVLKAQEPGRFARAVRAALAGEPGTGSIPSQTRSLARLWWPLVLSTNYDTCYAAAFRQASPERQLAIVGRSAEDCQRVLTSLSTGGRSLLWALQGFLTDFPEGAFPSNEGPELEALRRLEAQLVVGHEEYRRVTYRDLHFRRAFAEVFRQRSLLFLGAGIQESYLQELFGEVLEFYGPATRPHYAFMPQGEVDPAFMLARFQIVVVEYEKDAHEKVVHRLDRLAEEVNRPRRTAVSWSWGRITSAEQHWVPVADLEVVRGPLPTTRREGECLAVSAGGSGTAFFFSPGIRELMQRWNVRLPDEQRPDEQLEIVFPPYVAAFHDRHVYVVRARNEKDERGLSHIYDASLALFTHVGTRYDCIRMQLLATGGQEKRGVPASAWKVRTYPERFSFVQTVRAWAAWREREPDAPCRLALHVVLDAVYHDIASGRLDVLELLSCRDIRFFVEVISDAGEVERRLVQAMPDVTLRSIVQDLQLSPAHWHVEISPPPSLEERPAAVVERQELTLQQLGVLPGSTVHFRRPISATP
jgi:hypothetical protein